MRWDQTPFPILIAVTLFVSAAATLSANPADDAQQGPVTMTQAVGDVSVVREGKPIDPKAGLTLKSGDEIETKSGKAALRFAQGHEVALRPNTKVKLEPLLLRSGELLVRARGTFRVDTQFMKAGVEGTEFLIRAQERAAWASVVVLDGAVVCTSNAGAWERVRVAARERMDVLVTRGGPETVKRSASDEELKELGGLFSEFGPR
jgi:hypothetical protein